MPTVNTLTDTKCRQAEPGPKAKKIFDGHGLFLFVSPTGAKTWRMAYRHHGKQQTATFGAYPLLSLKEARAKRDELRKRLLDGDAPKKRVKTIPTVADAITTYWDGRRDLSDSYRSNAVRGLQMHLAAIASRPIDTITRDDLLAELMKMDAAGLFVYVRRVRMWFGQVLDWAIEQGHISENVATVINPKKAFGKAAVVSHAALRLADVPDFLARLAMEKELQSVLACRLMALTWVRTGELRMMEWEELEGTTWRIPEGKMKRRVEHLVPLSRQALQIIEQLRARSPGGPYVFPAEHRTDRPMSENAVLYLLHRMGYKGAMTGHGWRSVASTWANERGFMPDAIERQLAHVPADRVRAVYNRTAYLPERRAMLQAWADWLDNIAAGGLQAAAS